MQFKQYVLEYQVALEDKNIQEAVSMIQTVIILITDLVENFYCCRGGYIAFAYLAVVILPDNLDLIQGTCC